MSRISRDTFASTLAPGLDIGTLDTKTEAALEKAGLDKTTLTHLAGDDGVISGNNELNDLFDSVDRRDRNGTRRSIDTTRPGAEGKEELTASGELYEALEGAVAKARLARMASPPPAMRTERSSEAGASIERFMPDARAQNRAKATLEKQGFTDLHLAKDMPYFNQAEGLWSQHPYPKNPPEPGIERTLRDAGCAPTALAMADVALRGSRTRPDQVGDFSVKGKFSGTPTTHGTDSHGLGKAWAKAHDLHYTPARDKDAAKNVDTLRDGVKEGGVGIIGVSVDRRTGKGHFTEKGHIMVVNGYAKDKDGKEWFFVANPGRRDQSKGRVLTVDADVVQDKSLHNAAGQLRISRQQLEAEMRHGFVLSRQGPQP